MVMNPVTTATNPQVEQFWKGFFTTLNLFRIPEGAHPWYRKHIEAFVSFFPGVLEILCHFFKLAIKRNVTCLKNLILIKRWTPCEVVRT